MITIYTKTLRAAACEDVSDDDCALYDDHVDRYIEQLQAAAAAEGIEIEVEDDIGGRSYYADSPMEDAFMSGTRANFWEWYQAGN